MPDAEPTETHSFPAGFVWGAATSAYHIEGGARYDGRGVSIWDTFSHRPRSIVDGATGDVACDHYHRWESDLDLLKNLGIRSYRFSGIHAAVGHRPCRLRQPGAHAEGQRAVVPGRDRPQRGLSRRPAAGRPLGGRSRAGVSGQGTARLHSG